MAITFDLPEQDLYERLKNVMNKYHPELRDAEVTVQCLFARAEDENAPAVKAPGGWPAYAVIRRVPLKQRVAGFKDAEITFDERKYKELSEAQQDALIDHELSHLEVVYQGSGPGTPVETDDWGRPKLRIRQHDWECAGFRTIAERHGLDAIEVQQAQQLKDDHGKVLFQFGGVEVG